MGPSGRRPQHVVQILCGDIHSVSFKEHARENEASVVAPYRKRDGQNMAHLGEYVRHPFSSLPIVAIAARQLPLGCCFVLAEIRDVLVVRQMAFVSRGSRGCTAGRYLTTYETLYVRFTLKVERKTTHICMKAFVISISAVSICIVRAVERIGSAVLFCCTEYMIVKSRYSVAD